MTEARLADGWSVELGGVYQRIDHEDARYAEGSRNPPARATAIAQPAVSRFGLGEVTIRKRWDSGIELVSASAVVSNGIVARYDLSPVAEGVSTDSRTGARILSNETRISRATSRTTGWLIGGHGFRSVSRLTTTLDRRSERINATRIGTGVVDVALFGQAAVAIARKLTATLGGRVSYSEVQVLGPLPSSAATLDLDLDPLKRAMLRVLPSAALAWRPTDVLTIYGSHQRGYRVGGLTVIPVIDPVDGRRSFTIGSFRPDTVNVIEAGLRVGERRGSAFSGAFALSSTRWRDIQADLIDTYGPYTTNVGKAHILGLEGAATWRPLDGLNVSGAVFVARATRPEDGSSDRSETRLSLPNIPLFTVRADVERIFPCGEGQMLLRSRVRYVGRSEIGVGGSSRLRQGEYLEVGGGVEARRGGDTIFMEVDNLPNLRSNRFGLGNPYTAYRGDQRIPLQPRTIRLGVRRAFK